MQGTILSFSFNQNSSDKWSVYKLERILDDPRFEGFGADLTVPSLLGRGRLDDDLLPTFEGVPTPLGDRWRPLHVEGRVAEFNDYPCLCLLHPAFSDRAAAALGALLEPNGELLPLESGTQTKFFAYNITTVSDALDVNASRLTWASSKQTQAMAIEYFAFDPQKVAELTIFRIRQRRTDVFVTSTFVDAVKASGLAGFEFIKVWPLSADSDWRMLHKIERRKRVDQKRHSLAVMFSAPRDQAEEARLDAFKTKMDAKLMPATLDAAYVGTLSGSDVVDGECRLFFTCPDADRMFDVIQQDLADLGWARWLSVMRRYGELFDPEAKETINKFVHVVVNHRLRS